MINFKSDGRDYILLPFSSETLMNEKNKTKQSRHPPPPPPKHTHTHIHGKIFSRCHG